MPQETATNGFNADKSQEGEHDHEHEDESLFVGDKTLFSQDGIMKSDFRGMHSATGFTMQTEVS